MYLINNNFINNLEDLLVEESEEQMEEIILTLNYGGLFGINNINNYLQNKNNNKLYVFGFKKFKKGDPVLFYKDKDNYIIPQYTKGKILNIYISENETIYFDIELSITIDLVENSPEVDNIQILKSTIYKNAKNTVVKITTKYNNEEPNKLHLPFEQAYAVSIHKAQGLEYDSVKIIFPDNNTDQISFNIFYTAITRAKKD